MAMSRRMIGCLLLLPIASAALAQAPRDIQREERNRRLVVEFYEAVFARHDLSAADRYLSEDYIQHNPRVPDGRAPFVAAFSRLFAANPAMRSRILRSATDGDLVFLHVHSQSSPEARGRVIAEIFRVSGDRIVEHWDVMQDIPETAANNSGML
ncbi:nuclear transport factor 2 family protein [Methylobacterium variabile]|jgi:predicted SnoaL-like aldol condensation-catalyzing enzyme|nr:nuclear transport factor 2 family protein [Methylobacterium variabile]